jgi:hypothetical protein
LPAHQEEAPLVTTFQGVKRPYSFVHYQAASTLKRKKREKTEDSDDTTIAE